MATAVLVEIGPHAADVDQCGATCLFSLSASPGTFDREPRRVRRWYTISGEVSVARRISHVKVVLFGVLGGAVFGVSQGLLRMNPWVALAGGLVFGLVMALTFRRALGSTALRGLGRPERRAVSRAMRRGEAVEDPRVARPLVDQADVVLAMPYPVKAMRVGFVLLGLLGVLVSVVGFLDEGVAGAANGVLPVALSLLLLFVVLPLGERQRERVWRSRELTRERHQLSEAGPTADR